ncbi:hypothetical protein [Hydrocoleum sp. CS-953]|uniref:hypothetical protein n=1 Tax=Microcoleaceae TaxID=1892252 RepID=UPI000B9B8D14|nr:hypothetical protein [Hydrocoleum sp. CS-953]OZH51964.1 hypothetical protein AFK68_27490 [Hydrocoleum sp. CS-953]
MYCETRSQNFLGHAPQTEESHSNQQSSNIMSAGIGACKPKGKYLQEQELSLDFSANSLHKMLTFSALSTKKLVLFPYLKFLKPLSVNTFIFNQQPLNTYQTTAFYTNFNTTNLQRFSFQ